MDDGHPVLLAVCRWGAGVNDEQTPDVLHQPATVEEMLDAYQRHTRQLIAVLDSIVAATRPETERKETN